MSPIDRVCEQLRDQGRRVTPQRRAIIQVLLDDHSHPTADQVYTHVREIMPDISQATVYNTLRELVEIGILRELELGLGERHYEIITSTHAHLICLACESVEDVAYDCEALKPALREIEGYQIVNCHVIFHGYCPACTQARACTQEE